MAYSLKFPNFYLRNFILFILFTGLALTNVYVKNTNPSTWQILSSVLFYSYIFFWLLFHNKILLDKLYFQGKFIKYIILLISGYILFSLVAWLCEKYYFDTPFLMLRELFSFIINTSFAAALYISFKYLRDKQTLLKLELLKKESELNQLKAQLYPHFLFNALNNIYGYTLSGNKYGNELILKLSDLMRFILDVGTKELIPLENELQFIENYMAFEKERLGKRCLLNYRKDVSYYKREITPLLLFPFIENAFKYGANSIQPTEINILLIDNSTEFRMIIRNGILNKNTASTKLGLYNSKRRLELIYPKKHELNIKSDNGYYTAELILKYDEN